MSVVHRGLPDEVIAKLQPRLGQVLGSAGDVARAVLWAVTQPITVDVADMTAGTPNQLDL